MMRWVGWYRRPLSWSSNWLGSSVANTDWLKASQCCSSLVSCCVLDGDSQLSECSSGQTGSETTSDWSQATSSCMLSGSGWSGVTFCMEASSGWLLGTSSDWVSRASLTVEMQRETLVGLLWVGAGV